MAVKQMVGLAGTLVLALAASGCTVAATGPSYEKTYFGALIADETLTGTQPDRTQPMNEGEAQKEVDRLTALKPSRAVPSRVVLYEVPSTGPTWIKSAQKWLELRQATSQAMKRALEDTKVFESVEFLPDIFVPGGGFADLRTLRVAAARVHADGLLLYSTETGRELKGNPLMVLYITIIGAVILPGSQETSIALSKAVVVDVPTGYVSVYPEAYAKRTSAWLPAAWLNRQNLEFQARKQAIETLASEVAERFSAQARAVEPSRPAITVEPPG